MAKTTLTFNETPGKGWTATFTSAAGKEHIQVAKNPNGSGATYVEASNDGVTFAALTAPDSGRDLLIPIDVPQGVTVRVVSTDPVNYAAVLHK